MVERGDDTAGADGDALGHDRQRGPGDRRIGVVPAEAVKVPLGSPHRAEFVRVGEPRALDQEPVAVVVPSSRDSSPK